MNRDEVADFCETLPGAWPDTPWEDDLVYKLGNRNAEGKGGKVFIFFGQPKPEGVPEEIAIKTDPAILPALIDKYESVSIPSYLKRGGWIAVKLESDLPDEELIDLIEDSHERILSSFSKRQQRLITGADP